MDTPQIELKKIKTFKGMEGTGLNAEVWVDGVRTAYVIDDASGSIEFDFTVYNRPMFERLQAYVKSLPPREISLDYKTMWLAPTLETVIDEALHKQEMAKELKKIEKKFANHIIWGKKIFDGRYTQVKFKIPLAQLPTLSLQMLVDKYKSQLKEDEQFYNTNFEALKIKI